MDWVATHLLHWFDQYGRKDLPWQHPITPYRVWVSEIMLQQTQVTTVIPFYESFLERFPEVAELADAELDEVLHHWTGLGYYARGRNLHKAARQLMEEHAGRLPDTVEALSSLPGIGRSTAGAIASIAFSARAPILDGNVKRVLARFHAIPGYPGDTAVARKLWALAEEHTPEERVADYTQAIMDLGATLCTRTRPQCNGCPLADRCSAHARGTTADFPGRKPKKVKPVRQARLFLMVDEQGACLLERRPSEGLWGGLWTPPERPPETTVDEFLESAGFIAGSSRQVRIGEHFRHTFTHFHLDIEPVYLEVRGRPGLLHDRDDLFWYPAAGQARLGLTAPAVKLLASLPEFASND